MTNTNIPSRVAFRLAAAALTALLVSIVASIASAQTMEAAIDKAAKLYSTTKTARGSLEQTVTNSLQQSRNVTKADYQQQFPHKLSLNFTDPRGDRIVVDGTHMWLYLPSASPGIVSKLPISAASTWLNLINVVLNSDRSKFKVADAGRETIQNVQTRVVTFTPIQQDTLLIQAKLWIDEATGRVPQFEVKETAERTRRFRFTGMQFDVPVDTTRFKFVVPPGVTIDSRGR